MLCASPRGSPPRRGRSRWWRRPGSPRRWRGPSSGRGSIGGAPPAPRRRRRAISPCARQEEVGRVGPYEALRQRVGLGKEEPVPIADTKHHVRAGEGLCTWAHDVEHGGPEHALGVVECHPVGYPAPAVVAADVKALETELAHHRDLVLRHLPLGVGCVVAGGLRLGGVAVAPEVGGDEGETPASPGATSRYITWVRGLPWSKGSVGRCRQSAPESSPLRRRSSTIRKPRTSHSSTASDQPTFRAFLTSSRSRLRA
jgi:hypothetical protein